VILYTSLGLTNVQSLALASGWITETFFAIAIGNLIVDKIGRRKLLREYFVYLGMVEPIA